MDGTDKTEEQPPPVRVESTQEAGSDAMPVQVVDWTQSHGGLEQYPMTDAVRQIADMGGFRNQTVRPLLQALCQLRETDLGDARNERQRAEVKVQAISDEYHSEYTKRKVLEERLRCGLPMKKLQNILLSLGGVFLGAGLQPLLAGFSATNCIFALAGIIMLVGGWWHSHDSSEEMKK